MRSDIENPFPCPEAAPEAAEVELGVQRAEEDVDHVEWAKRSLLEHRGELVAVASAPARRV